jgi:uncharacterized phage infection (PIP) family protein YhgE
MLFKRFFALNNILNGVLFFVVVLGFASDAQISFAEISINSYCQVSIQSLQQDTGNFQELVSLANQYKNDPERFAQVEKIKQIEFKKKKADLFASFGTTDREYVAYMGENQPKVDAYLRYNPDIKKQIDDLAANVRKLLQEFETLKEGMKRRTKLP